MERGDERQVDAAGGKHLLGEVGADAVRDGVVNVEEIERVPLGDFSHAGGECEVVGWVLEQGVVEELDLVEMDMGLAAGEAEGGGGGDEVDLMSARGKLDPELRGDNAGATVRGVAGDADF